MRTKRWPAGWLSALALAPLLAIVLAALPATARTPNRELVATLAALQNLSGAFAFVIDWSANPTPPASLFMDYEQVEAQILNLPLRDRDAVLFWLQSHGRERLLDRGVSDAQIGPRRFPIDTFVTAPAAATSNPQAGWHMLPFIAGTLGPQPAVPVTILNGLSMVKDDATSEVHCVSFKNIEAKTAVGITFAYQFLDQNRSVLADLTSTRNGTFSPGVNIDGPIDFASYLGAQAGSPGTPRSLVENCWRNDVGTATLALLQARYFTFRLTSVKYADGSSWNAPPVATF